MAQRQFVGEVVDRDAHMFNTEDDLIDIAGANAVLNDIEPVEASPARKVITTAMIDLVNGRATFEQVALLKRAERLKEALNKLHDHAPGVLI